MKKKLTKPQLELLFECWKNGSNTKEWLELITKQLPKVPPLLALSVMRRMAKTDDRWQRAATRKKNKKEKEKREKQIEKEKRKTAAVQKKQERENKKIEKNKIRQYKDKINNIKENLKIENAKDVCEKINMEFFFCPDINQYVNNISCIFRLFSNDYPVMLDAVCEKCQRMNKCISILEDIVNARQKKPRGRRTSKDRGEIKEEKPNTTKGTNKTPSSS